MLVAIVDSLSAIFNVLPTTVVSISLTPTVVANENFGSIDVFSSVVNLKVQFLFVWGSLVVVLVVVDVVVLVVLVDVVVVDVMVVFEVTDVVVGKVVSRLVTNAELVVEGGCVVEVVDVEVFGLVVDELLVPKSVGFFL